MISSAKVVPSVLDRVQRSVEAIGRPPVLFMDKNHEVAVVHLHAEEVDLWAHLVRRTIGENNPDAVWLLLPGSLTLQHKLGASNSVGRQDVLIMLSADNDSPNKYHWRIGFVDRSQDHLRIAHWTTDRSGGLDMTNGVAQAMSDGFADARRLHD